MVRAEHKIASPADNTSTLPQFRRVLRLRDLIFYGLIIITPIAPVPIYGVAQQLSRGQVIACLLLAGMAMMLTAFSYGRMSALYPSAGSAYVYVGRGLNSHLGFLAGWSMTLDYLVLPIVAIIQASLAMQRLVPAVPRAVWNTLFVMLITSLNLRGVRATARANTVLLIGMSVVIAAFFVLGVRFIFAHAGLSSINWAQPIYNRETFDLRAIATATSFAALTYIGFDGVTTLAEEVDNPRKNILIATVSVCIFTTLFSCALVYLAQVIWPDYHTFPNIETGFMDVTKRIGGQLLFMGMGTVVALSSFGGGLAGEVAAARLLLSMGRDGVMPRKLFSYLDPKRSNPVFNIVLISIIAWIGSLTLSLESSGELLNFGAFIAFMGVNLSAIRQYYFLQPKDNRSIMRDLLLPLLGFLFSFEIWLSLPRLAKYVGGAWLVIGMIYYVARSRRNRVQEVASFVA
jgi:amino acid transporter